MNNVFVRPQHETNARVSTILGSIQNQPKWY